MNGNYIKICRSLLDWEWFKNQNTLSVFIYCLLKANWKDGKFEGMDIPRGSFVTSVATIAKDVNLSPKQVRVALNHLKETNEVAIKTTNKFSVITINKYADYQDEGKQEGNQRANKGQTKGKQRATIEEGNKGIREEGNKSVTRFTPPSTTEVKDYCDEKGYHVDPDRFVDYYASKGWMVGANKMKDWKAALRNWERKDQAAKPKKKEPEVTDGFKLWD